MIQQLLLLRSKVFKFRRLSPGRDNNGINTDDDRVSDHENVNTFNQSATKFASIDEQTIFIEDIYDPRN
jgi:hypothetical protein